MMINITAIPIIGKTALNNSAALKPNCSAPKPSESAISCPHALSDTPSTTIPKIWGANAQPKSPPDAIKAYAATPGAEIFSSIIISVPGQSIAVNTPVNMHASKDKTTFVEKPATT